MRDIWGKTGVFVIITLFLMVNIEMARSSISAISEGPIDLPSYMFDGGLEFEQSLKGGVRFIENRGQWSGDIRYLAQTPFGYSAVADDGIRYGLVNEDGGMNVVGYHFIGAKTYGIRGVSRLPTKYNYFIGSDPSAWVHGAMAYEEILLEDIWPGVDLRLYSSDGSVKYDMVLAPGSDPTSVRFSLEGIDHLNVVKGDLMVSMDGSTRVLESGLLAYQQDVHAPLGSSFRVMGDREFGFEVEDIDPALPLVIDPLVAGNFIGGFDWEYARDLFLDVDDNQYITGETTSTDFPTNPGSYDKVLSGGRDIFVVKTDEIGQDLLVGTYIGGSADDIPMAISADPDGNIYVAGYTRSWDFPISQGALNGTKNGSDHDGFVLKLNETGGELLFSTFVGGKQRDLLTSMVLADNGDILLCGTTWTEDMYRTEGSYHFEFTGTRDAFITRISPDGSRYVFSFLYGGPAVEECFDIEELLDGSIVICGNTSSFELPMTSNSYDPDYNDLVDIFLARFSGDGKDLVSSTFLGGDSEDVAFAIDVDGKDSIYVTGYTQSIDFPTTSGVYQEDYSWVRDVYASKFDSNLSVLQYSTFIGMDSYDMADDISVDHQGRAYILGKTSSIDFPVTWGVLQSEMEGTGDLFLTILEHDASSLVYSTYVGGEGNEMGSSISIGNNGAVYIAGWASSSTFPHRTNGFGPYIQGSSDGFAIGIDLSLPPSEPYGLSGDLGDEYLNLTWRRPVQDYDLEIKRYHVHRWLRNLSGPHQSFRRDGSPLFFNDSFVDLGNTYLYGVVAETQAGFSNMSELLIVECYVPPSPPREIEIVHEDAVINVSWGPPVYFGGSGIRNFSIEKEWEGGNTSYMVEARMDGNFLLDYDFVKGVTYTYRIKAWNGYHWSLPIEGEVRPLTPTSPPRELTAVSGNGFAFLEWLPPEDLGGSEVAGYHLYRGISRGNESLMTTLKGKNTTFNDTSVANGLSYTYFLRCANEFGISEQSDNADAAPIGPPYPPWKLTAEIGDLGISIKWDPPFSDGGSPIHTYKIFRSQPDVEPYLLLEVDGSTLTYIDRGVEPNSIYFYHVIAISDLGQSDPSEMVQVVLDGYPTPPRDLVLTRGNRFVEIWWSPPADTGFSEIRTYRIYRKEEGGTYTFLERVQGSFLSFNDTTVQNGQLYFYRITAVNDRGESRPSMEDSAMPVGVPTHPVNLVAKSRKEHIELSWSPPSDNGGVNIVRYMIYRGPDPGNMTLLTEVHFSLNTYRDEDVAMGLSYYYYVTAFNGKYYSQKSQLVRGVPKSSPMEPVNFTVDLVEGRAVLKWRAPLNNGGSDILHYHVYRKVDEGSFQEFASLGGSIVNYEDIHLDEPGRYSYYVTAENEMGEGPRTDIHSIEVVEEGEPDDGIWGSLRTGAVTFLGLSVLLMALVVLLVIWKRSRGASSEEE
ncbi:MAG: fibronectin type III domain-containing protein [Thermoplasmatota archaeon]